MVATILTLWLLGAVATCSILVWQTRKFDGSGRAGQVDVGPGDYMGLAVCSAIWPLYWPAHWFIHKMLGY